MKLRGVKDDEQDVSDEEMAKRYLDLCFYFACSLYSLLFSAYEIVQNSVAKHQNLILQLTSKH